MARQELESRGDAESKSPSKEDRYTLPLYTYMCIMVVYIEAQPETLMAV